MINYVTLTPNISGARRAQTGLPSSSRFLAQNHKAKKVNGEIETASKHLIASIWREGGVRQNLDVHKEGGSAMIVQT